jgi:cob(I)alamin adenosyltransferase
LKIYTKTGDAGQTGLLGGVRISKSHLAIQVCGSLDETNCLLGVALSYSPPSEIAWRLTQIQNDLFDLGSRVAASLAKTTRAACFPAARTEALEQWIDHFQERTPALTQFILPGGSVTGAYLHHSRAVCRRGERDLVRWMEALGHAEGTTPKTLSLELAYLNRLSDLLFVMARFVNHAAKIPETHWKVTPEPDR